MRNPATTKDRKFAFVLYPDSTSYSCVQVLAAVKRSMPEWAYVLHDKDIDWETGESKKPHYHVLVKVPSPVLRSVIAHKVEIPETDVQLVGRYKDYARYLIHADDGDKAQYRPEDVTANWEYRLVLDFGAEKQAEQLFVYVAQNPHCTLSELFAYAMYNNCYAEFRRGYRIFKDLREEQLLFAGQAKAARME